MATLHDELLQTRKVAEFDGRFVDRTAIKAVSRLFDRWRVDNATGAFLAGATVRTWQRMKGADWPGRLSQDQRMRLSALVGLYQALHVYFGDPLADDWVGLENDGPLFDGDSPLNVMVEGGLPAIIRIRDHVDALRGGL